MTILRATLFQSYQGQILENVLIFQGGCQGDALEMQSLANDVEIGWCQQVKTEQVGDLRYFQIKVEVIGSGLAPFLKTVTFPARMAVTIMTRPPTHMSFESALVLP